MRDDARNSLRRGFIFKDNPTAFSAIFPSPPGERMSLIIGVNAYHGDSSACILSDGKLIAAAEEERFRRVKHWAGFPDLAVKYCLAEAGADIRDVDIVAVNRDPSAQFWHKVLFSLRRRPNPLYIL